MENSSLVNQLIVRKDSVLFYLLITFKEEYIYTSIVFCHLTELKVPTFGTVSVLIRTTKSFLTSDYCQKKKKN